MPPLEFLQGLFERGVEQVCPRVSGLRWVTRGLQPIPESDNAHAFVANLEFRARDNARTTTAIHLGPDSLERGLQVPVDGAGGLERTQGGADILCLEALFQDGSQILVSP